MPPRRQGVRGGRRKKKNVCPEAVHELELMNCSFDIPHITTRYHQYHLTLASSREKQQIGISWSLYHIMVVSSLPSSSLSFSAAPPALRWESRSKDAILHTYTRRDDSWKQNNSSNINWDSMWRVTIIPSSKGREFILLCDVLWHTVSAAGGFLGQDQILVNAWSRRWRRKIRRTWRLLRFVERKEIWDGKIDLVACHKWLHDVNDATNECGRSFGTQKPRIVKT